MGNRAACGIGLEDGVEGISGDEEDTQDNVKFDEGAEAGEAAIEGDVEDCVPNTVEFGDVHTSQSLG